MIKGLDRLPFSSRVVYSISLILALVFALFGFPMLGDLYKSFAFQDKANGIGGPVISATLEDSFADMDMDMKAAPGEEVTYTATIQNTGTDATGVQFSATLGSVATLVPGSVNVSPIAIDDAYSSLGNTLLEVTLDHAGAASAQNTTVTQPSVIGETTTPKTYRSVLENDADPGAMTSALTVAVVPASVTAGATVTMFTDGTFEYMPPVGSTGPDTFEYTATDTGGLEDTGTVTINISDLIWFVDKDNAGTADGRSSSPYISLAAIDAGGADDGKDGTGDTIFVYGETTGNTSGGLLLENNQILHGNGVALSPTGFEYGGGGALVPAGTRPTIEDTAGDVIVLASGNTVRGLDIAATNGRAIFGGNTVVNGNFDTVASTGTGSGTGIRLDGVTGTFTFGNVDIDSSTGAGIDIQGGSATFTFDSLSSITSPSGAAFNVNGGTANIDYDGTITQNNAATAVKINGKTMGTVSFDGAVTANISTAKGIDLTSNTGSTITFSGLLDIDTTTGTGFNATGGGTVNVTGSGNTITVTGAGQAVVMNGTDLGGSDVTFDSITSTGAGASAPFADVLSFTNLDNAGTFEGGTVTIVDTAGVADGIDISGGSANFDFTSFTVANAGGSGINVDSATGDITFDTINIDAPGANGVLINAYAGAASDNFTISGGTIDDPGVDGVNISGAISQVNVGSLVIDDTGGEGVEISNSSGTINVTNTTIGVVGGTGTTGGNALDINGGAGTVTVNGSIVNTAGRSVDITNRTGGSVNIGSGIDEDGTGINLGSNTGGTINLSGGMALDTGSNTAFNATGGGTVNVTGTNTIGASGAISGIGVDIDNVDIGGSGLTFASLAVDGASHGIRIENAAGNATFTTVEIANTVQSSAQTFSPFSGVNTRETPNENGNGDGIYLQDNTGTFAVNGGTITSSGDNAIDVFDCDGVTISGVTIDGSANTAVQATRVANLEIIDSMIKNFGNATAVSTARENGVTLREVTGAIKLQRSTIDTGFGFVFERFAQLPENIGLELNNISASDATLTVTGSTIKKLDFEGMQVRYQDSNVTVRLDGSTVDGANALSLINGAAINFGQTAADGGSTGTLVVNDSTMTDVGIGTRVGNLSNTGGAPASVTNVRLEDNVITRTFSEGFRLRGFGGPNRSTFNQRIIDNDIFDVGRAISTVVGPGQSGAGSGIESLLEDRIDAKILIDGNTIDDVTPDAGSLGVNIRTTDGTDLDLVFTNNMVLDVGNPAQGITGSPTGIVEIGAFANVAEPNPDTCVHFTGNTLTPRVSVPVIFTSLFLDDTSPAANYVLQGFTAGGGSVPVSTFLDTTNTMTTGQFGFTVGVANAVDAHGGTTCSQPPAIPLFSAEDEKQLALEINKNSRGQTSPLLAGLFAPNLSFDGNGDRLFKIEGLLDLNYEKQMAPEQLVVASGKANGFSDLSFISNSLWSFVSSIASMIIPTAFAEEEARTQSNAPNKAPMGAADVNVGPFDLPAGKSVTIVFKATVANPNSAPMMSLQGTVSGSNFTTVMTDDPDVGGASDPTVTPLLTSPSAAGATVSGRAVSTTGRGLENVRVILSGGDLTEPLYTQTNPFGYFLFKDIEVGQTYVVTVSSKRYEFRYPTQLVNVDDDLVVPVFIGGR